jgi:hypothetical protein
MRTEEWRSHQRPKSAGRRCEERRLRVESPSFGHARGRGGWRQGDTHAAQSGLSGQRGPRVWPARDGDRRRRGQQSEPRSSMGPGPWLPR